MLKKIIILSTTIVFGLLSASTIAQDGHDHDEDTAHLHGGDIQPWRTGAEIFVNKDLFETDFGDISGGPFVTDDPGVDVNIQKGTFTPGNWLRFQPVGQLLFWDGINWQSTVPNGERIEIKDVLDNAVTFHPHGVSENTGIIGQIDSEGGLHEHLDFSIFDASNTPGGSPGAYRIQLKLFESQPDTDISVSIATSPVAIVFNRGLEHEHFEQAVSAAADLNHNAVFVADNGILTIHEVKALGTFYRVKLQYIGNDQFQLIEAEEIPAME
ncbi:MAG: hypothetical protein KF908_01145 [Nitrosomonas sp.]|nr:hypothetical protein [Nitrosomonas sp.]MCW5606485.1 hypothetical protein [Nitrosomonas sp.]